MTGTVHVDRAAAKKILAGDEAAFRELFESYYPRLFRFAVGGLDLAVLICKEKRDRRATRTRLSLLFPG